MKSLGVFVLMVLLIGCSKRQDVVAEVDDEQITIEEFAARYQQFLSNGGKNDNILLRQEILNNMINERLINYDAGRQRFDSDEAYKRRMQVAQTQALLDGYARRISWDTIKITEPEVKEEFRYYNTTASARYLYGKSEANAAQLKLRLEKGETFNDLAREVFRDPGLANNGGYLGTFGWGEMEPALEEAAFTLPLGAASDPIKLNIGYAIVQPETRVHQPLVSEYDYAKVRQQLADKIQEKKIGRLVRVAADEASKSLAATFDRTAVNKIFENWELVTKPLINNVESNSVLPKNITSMKFMEFSRGTWTVGDFVQNVEWTTESQQRRVKSPDDVQDIALGLATREVLVERARGMGLDKDSAVKGQIASVRERYLLQRWSSSVTDTIGNSGWPKHLIDSMFTANRSQYAVPPEVNVAEILVRNESDARMLRAKLRRGANFAELAKQHSIRLWAGNNGGELGFGTIATFGPMGEKFFSAKVGEIIGPEMVDPYWGVFKILELRPGRPKTIKEAQESVIAGLVPVRRQAVARSAIDNLRSKAAISIDQEILSNIVIQNDYQAKR